MGTAQQVLTALLPMLLGLGLRLIGLFDERQGRLLREFVVRFTVPIFVLFSLYDAHPESIAAIAPTAGAFVLMTLALFAIGWAASRMVRQPGRKTAVHACVTFGNYGWMGLGVVGALLGEEGAQRVVYFILLWWPVFYGVGLTIGWIHTRGRRGGVPVRRTVAIAAPPMAAMLLGLALNLGGVPLPALVQEVLRPFGRMTVPLILLSVGLLLDLKRLRSAVGPALAVSGIALVAGPLIGWGLAALLARDRITFQAIVLEGAMPVATLTPVLEENYEMDSDLVSSAIVMSTALSLVTIPVVAFLLPG